ncbi:hypothetical protein LCGC14_2877440, partial [marine sediment metagenome]
LATRTITVVVTQDATAVTSAALFVATDLNRQFRVGDQPIYTIVTFTDTSNIVLDRAYAGVDNASASAEFVDFYARMPADFGAFDTIWDVTNDRPLVYAIPRHDMMRLDPGRTQAQDPRALVDFDVQQSDGRVRYEWYPHATAVRQYPMIYQARPQTLTDSTDFRGVLNTRTDVLIEGALAKAALWPGTAQSPNPYFSLGLSDRHQVQFEKKIQSLGLRDDDMGLASYSDYPWARWRAGGITQSDTLLRESDASIEDYI